MKDGKLEAKDLMIGDWIRVKVLSPFTDADTYYYRRWIREDCLVGTATAQPILLTAEILEKNGIPTNGDAFYFDNNYMPELCYQNGVLSWTINCHEYDILNFKYVHELQHALRLCGLTELADNFKIE